MKTKYYSIIWLLTALTSLVSCTKSSTGTAPANNNNNSNNNSSAGNNPVANMVSTNGISATSFTAVWQQVPGASKYLLYLAADSLFQHPLTGYNPATVIDTTLTVNNLTPGTTYFFRVQASVNGNTSGFSNTVQVVTASRQWVVSTFAGTFSSQGGFADGQGTAAKFNFPAGITIDGSDNLYVLDNNRIRKITPAGLVSTFSGSGIQGTVDGPATTAQLYAYCITYDRSSGNLFIGDQNCIRKADASGTITTVAGSAAFAGVVDGPGTAARLYGINCLSADPSGNVYFYQLGNNTGINDALRKLAPSSMVTTIKTPMGISTTGGGIVFYNNNLYIGNPWAFNILISSLSGNVGVFAGLPSPNGAYQDGDIASAKFGYIKCIAADATGNFYVSDQGNNCIRKISNTNTVSTFAGTRTSVGSAEGPALTANMSTINGIAIDSKGNVFVLDQYNNCVRKISYQ